MLPYKDQSQTDKIANALRKAGLKWVQATCKKGPFT
jgi:hypothetical protein